MSYANPRTPYINTVVATAGQTTTIQFTGTAVFCQLMNMGSQPITVGLNGSTGKFPLANGDVQVFSERDLDITSIQLVNTTSGAQNTNITVIAGIVD